MSDRRSRLSRAAVMLVLITALFATAILSTGCDESEPEYDTVTDSEGRYHFLVPSGWQSVSDPSLLAVYASEELPAEDESLDVLSIVVLNGEATEDTEPTEMLTEFVDTRGESRGWQEAQISEPSATSIGGREAVMIEVSALDSVGVPFLARFYQVRTAGTDYIIVGVMPGDEWNEADTEIDGILERWYWNTPDDGSAEDTETVTEEESAE